MATRTLSSERDRRMTILLTPFMSCSAKLPIYTMMISAFFPRRYRALAMIGLYLFGILCGILYAVILKVSRFKENSEKSLRFCTFCKNLQSDLQKKQNHS